jgi:prepilin-type N-terminal cleavage/methylation domain-containing protein
VKKKNNSGFSLVELMVTVAILAIIVAPLLRAFVVSAQTNTKAKERLRATNLAENLMENMEATGLRELSKQVNAKSFRLLVGGSSTAENSCELHKETDSSTRFSEATITDTVSEFGFVSTITATASSALVDAAAGTYEFRGSQNADNCYYFALGGLRSDGKTYDALIMVSPASSGSNGKDVNTSDLAEISTINSDTSHVVTCSYADVISDMQYIINNYDGDIVDAVGASCGNYEDYKTKIQRTVTVSLADKSAVVNYSYDLVDGCRTNRGLTNLLRRTETVLADTGDGEAQIEDLYLMLYPWYNGNSAVADQIIVNNPDNLTADIIVAAQTKLDADTRSEASNLLYAMNIRVVEKAETSGTMSAHTHVNIRTQIADDISLSWGRYQYISDSSSLLYGTSKDEIAADLVETSRQGRNFDVTICIYPAGTIFDEAGYRTDFSPDTVEAYSTFTGGMVY